MLRHRGFCGKPRRDHGLGQLRDMCNRLVDHEEFSAQRCFYHDVAVPINGKPHFPALTGSGCEVALFNEPPPGQIGCSLII